MDTLCSLVLQLGPDFAIFVTINKHRFTHAKYENLFSKLLNGERLPQETSVIELLRHDTNAIPEFTAPADRTKTTVNQQHLKQA
ncbi:hypothetical protein BD410DRAFT_842738 [Rickenella mellea]|uniref:Uncharacterized protein n=1 Tax=Rickenella mellea TaxID=50990 RepID=A0A4Y7PT50_9AGAM|nr:hypothetical protein BD410DRAFT_842738 [Rickenella mellea]